MLDRHLSASVQLVQIANATAGLFKLRPICRERLASCGEDAVEVAIWDTIDSIGTQFRYSKLGETTAGCFTGLLATVVYTRLTVTGAKVIQGCSRGNGGWKLWLFKQKFNSRRVFADCAAVVNACVVVE